MPMCMGIKTDHNLCERQAHAGAHQDNEPLHLHFCSIHWTTYSRHFEAIGHHHVDGGCIHHTRTRWCINVNVEGTPPQCQHHRLRHQALLQRRQEERAQQDRLDAVLTEWMRRVPVPDWRHVIGEALQIHRVDFRDQVNLARRFYQLTVERWTWRFERYLIWIVQGAVGPEPDLVNPPRFGARGFLEENVPPADGPAGPREQVAAALAVPVPRPRTLHAIAADRQNVHTAVVARQTNDGLNKLLEVHREAGQPRLRSADWFASKWLTKSYGPWERVRAVVDDMYRWYKQSYCREENDHLYRRALDGLYLLIKQTSNNNADLNSELHKRVFEECFESIGLCCDGHISRLCNVLVGFDESFTPPVPFGEILQSKMAAISMMEIETEEKIRQATAFFNEFAVPEPDRTAWLEAF